MGTSSTSPGSLRNRIWLVAALVGVAALAWHTVLPVGSLEQALLYDGIAAATVAAILVAVRLHRPEFAAPWLLIAVGQASFVVGDLMWVWFELNGETPFPSVADAFYLAGYPFLALAFGLLIRRRIGGGDRAGLLDAAILTTGASILSLVLFIEPAIAGSEATALELAISLGYPLADLAVIGIATGLLTTPGARTPSFGLLVAGLLVLLGADEIYALQNLDGTYVSGSLLDLGWLVAYLATALAALHPSMREVVRPQPVNITWLGPVRLLFLAAAMLTGPLVMTLVGRVPGSVGWVVAGASGFLSLLVLARLAGLVTMLARDVAARRALEAQLSHQANHDPLTGLAIAAASSVAPATPSAGERVMASPRCSSTSTTSRRSTTRSVTRPAMNCSSRSASGSAVACVTATSRRASVATSSASSSRRCRIPRWPRQSPLGSWLP